MEIDESSPAVNGKTYYVLIHTPDDPRYRSVPAFKYSVTWDHTPMTCYYVGNSQGGPEDSHNPTESVIEGDQSQYVTSSLFATEFEYNQFEDTYCSVAE